MSLFELDTENTGTPQADGVKSTTKKSTKKSAAKKSSTRKSTSTRRRSSSGKVVKNTRKEIIPGVSINLSWEKILGITKLKRWFGKNTGLPTSEAGLQRKIGKAVIDIFTGKKGLNMGDDNDLTKIK